MFTNRFIVLIIIVIAFVAGTIASIANLFPATVIKQVVSAAMTYSKSATVEGPNAGNPVGGDVNDTTQQGLMKSETRFQSAKLGAEITVLEGVFDPYEAENAVLEIMEDNANLFKDATVMEIGTGSGIISLYAAKLGARKVVATDINPKAIQTITMNAEELGYKNVIEPRLVSLDDISAYAVIGDDETFDIIISNPPYALDLDAPGNDAVTDNGELGFSIVRGFRDHLNPDGMSILWYNSLFYHDVMVKFARYEGYEVRNHLPNGMFPWEAEALFNSYLKRLLVHEGMPVDAFQFDYSKDKSLYTEYLRNQGLQPWVIGYEPLFPDGTHKQRYYAGTIVIGHSDKTRPDH